MIQSFFDQIIVKEERIVTGTYQGLCSTCNNAVDCMQLRQSIIHVLNCELFDDYLPPPAIIEINTNESIESDVLRRHEPKNRDLIYTEGLCWDCEVRETCMNRKHRGGIWYCEGYV